ncbi:MAG: hypothetical protein ACKVQU_25955 [Burkholderiales bacterium]
MADIAIGIALLGALTFVVAGYEHARKNPRDAMVLAGFGALFTVGAGAAWFA